MPRTLVFVFAWIATCVALQAPASSAAAATIIKLDLGADPSDDIHYSSAQLSTIDEGIAASMGHQQTAAEFVDFLDSIVGDITGPNASFTLQDLIPTGPSTTFMGSLVAQDFLNGSFSLYSPDNSILLSADLIASCVTGPLGNPGEEALFLATGQITGGTLAKHLTRDSLRLRMRLPLINGGGGFSVTPSPDSPPPIQFFAPLVAFGAAATVEIQAVPIPEPAGAALLSAAAIGVAVCRRRRACR